MCEQCEAMQSTLTHERTKSVALLNLFLQLTKDHIQQLERSATDLIPENKTATLQGWEPPKG